MSKKNWNKNIFWLILRIIAENALCKLLFSNSTIFLFAIFISTLFNFLLTILPLFRNCFRLTKWNINIFCLKYSKIKFPAKIFPPKKNFENIFPVNNCFLAGNIFTRDFKRVLKDLQKILKGFKRFTRDFKRVLKDLQGILKGFKRLIRVF